MATGYEAHMSIVFDASVNLTGKQAMVQIIDNSANMSSGAVWGLS